MPIGDIPKKIIEELGEAALSNLDPSSILDALDKVDKGATEIIKKFGASRDMIQSLRSNMADAVTSVSALGGGFSDILSLQKGISDTLGRNLILSSDSFEKMYATAQASGQEYDVIVSKFKDVGVSVYASTKQMGDVVNIARASGVNAEKVSFQVLSNMDALNKYNFEGGVQGLAKMAAQATSLRIDMSSSLDFAERVFDPEGAIKMAASLQRLGVAQSDLLDPLRLMDLAQNDPGELQNQIAKMSEQFVQLKKDGSGFEIMPGAKRQMREIEKEMGLPLGQLSKMALASADLSEKMKKIQFPSATEDQKMMIANMAEMKGGEYMVNFTDSKGVAQEKRVTELSKDDIEALGKASAPKTMEELTKEQLNIEQSMNASLATIRDRLPYAIAGSRVGKAATEAPRELYAGVEKIFSGESLKIKNLRKGIDENSDLVFGALKRMATGEGSLNDISLTFVEIGNSAKEFLGKVTSEMGVKAKEAVKGSTTSTNPFVSISATAVKTAGDAVINKVNPTAPPTIPNNLSTTNVQSANNQTQSNTTSTMDLNHTLTVNIMAPSHINTDQVIAMFNDTGVKQKMIEVVKTGVNNNGLTGGNSSKTKQMNGIPA